MSFPFLSFPMSRIVVVGSLGMFSRSYRQLFREEGLYFGLFKSYVCVLFVVSKIPRGDSGLIWLSFACAKAARRTLDRLIVGSLPFSGSNGGAILAYFVFGFQVLLQSGIGVIFAIFLFR